MPRSIRRLVGDNIDLFPAPLNKGCLLWTTFPLRPRSSRPALRVRDDGRITHDELESPATKSTSLRAILASARFWKRGSWRDCTLSRCLGDRPLMLASATVERTGRCLTSDHMLDAHQADLPAIWTWSLVWHESRILPVLNGVCKFSTVGIYGDC